MQIQLEYFQPQASTKCLFTFTSKYLSCDKDILQLVIKRLYLLDTELSLCTKSGYYYNLATKSIWRIPRGNQEKFYDWISRKNL